MNARGKAPTSLLKADGGQASPVSRPPERRVRVAITSDPGELAVVERLLETLLGLSDVASGRADEIVLAVSEAVCNVMRHGYAERHDRPLEIELRVVPGLVGVAVEDRAPPPPDALVRALCERDVTLPVADGTDPETIAESGWGLGLIARASQAIRYRRHDGGNRLELDFEVPLDDGSRAPLA